MGQTSNLAHAKFQKKPAWFTGWPFLLTLLKRFLIPLALLSQLIGKQYFSSFKGDAFPLWFEKPTKIQAWNRLIRTQR
jgi:hypothetical protein